MPTPIDDIHDIDLAHIDNGSNDLKLKQIDIPNNNVFPLEMATSSSSSMATLTPMNIKRTRRVTFRESEPISPRAFRSIAGISIYSNNNSNDNDNNNNNNNENILCEYWRLIKKNLERFKITKTRQIPTISKTDKEFIYEYIINNNEWKEFVDIQTNYNYQDIQCVLIKSHNNLLFMMVKEN